MRCRNTRAVRPTRTVRTVAGAVVATMALVAGASAQQLPARDKALTGEPTDVFRVGEENGREYETFSNVPAVAFDRAGSLYVLDRDNARILVFDRAGKFVRQIGRKGQGPGELGLPMAMTVTTDDRVVVFDLMNAGLSVFGADGEYAKLVRTPMDVRPSTAMGMFAHPSGGVVVAGSQMGGMGEGGPPRIGDTLPILLIPIDDGEARTLYEAPSPRPEVVTSGSENERQVSIQPPPTFSPQVRFGVRPDGRLVVSHDSGWKLGVVADGAVASTISRPLEARAVTARDRDAARDQQAERLRTGAGMIRMEMNNGQRTASVGGGGMPEPQVQQMLAAMRFAEVVPQIRGLAVDRTGRTWVAREGGPGRLTEGPIDLIGPSGEYIGTLTGTTVPNAFGPDGLAAYIVTDDYDVPSVVVRRLPDWK